VNRSQTEKAIDGARVSIGIHTSIAGRLELAAERARELGCDGFQIFTSSPRGWARPTLDPAEVEAFRHRRETLLLDPLVVHCNYLINLASAQPLLRARSIQAFKEEILRAQVLKTDFLVLHPGSAAGQKRIDAVRNVIESLQKILSAVRLSRLQVLLENTAGQGSVLGADLKELAVMVDALRDFNVGVCIDTAHLHGAGYDICTEDGLEETLAKLHAAIGLDRVKVIHLNDSKVAFGSRVDRHENIGKGTIGSAALQRVLQHRTLKGKPFILETPIDKPGDDKRNLQAARDLADGTARKTQAAPSTRKKAKKKTQKKSSKRKSRTTVRKTKAKRNKKKARQAS
jgi:deoxyribonuclease-4